MKRYPAPLPGSRLTNLWVFDTKDNVKCKYKLSTEAFEPLPPASVVHTHNTTHQLEVAITLNMQDTQTLLHRHLLNKPL